MPKSVNRTLDILEAVCAADGPLDLHEISRLANLPNSTTHRLLQTLVERGYTRHISDSHRYRAGLKVFELSRAIVGNMPLLEAARRPLHMLAERVQETVHLAVLDSNEVLYLHQV